MRLLNALSLFCICIADCHDERSIYNSWELFGINSQAKCLPTNFGNIDSKSASSGTSTNEFRSQASNAGIEKIIEGGDGEIANDTLQNLKTSDENLVKEINESDYGNVPREATGGVDALTSDSRSGNEENDTNMDPPPAAVEVELPGVEEIPPGSSSYNRESILINLSKKIAAIEFNLTLSTEYLSEFSKHYVNQMNEYKVEAAESRRNNAHEIAKQVNLVIRTQMTHVRQEIEDLKRKFTMLQTERNKHQYGLSKTYVNYQHRCVNGPLSESTARVSRMLQLTNVFDNQKRLPATFAIPSSWNGSK